MICLLGEGDEGGGGVGGKQGFVSCGGETWDGSSFCFWSHSYS